MRKPFTILQIVLCLLVLSGICLLLGSYQIIAIQTFIIRTGVINRENIFSEINHHAIQKSDLTPITLSAPVIHYERIPYTFTCQWPTTAIIEKRTKGNHMTQDVCRSFCLQQKNLFAATFNGTDCYCLNMNGLSWVDPDESCNVTCAGNSSQYCGGYHRWRIEQIDTADTINGWSVWMSFSRESRYRKTALKTRIRTMNCTEYSQDRDSECPARVHVYVPAKMPEVELALLQTPIKHLIGCFTEHSFLALSNLTSSTEDIGKMNVRDLTYQTTQCLMRCQNNSNTYAVLTRHKCICTETLGWSQPVDVCYTGIGAIVLSTQPTAQSLTLKYLGRRTLRKLSVLAHYRGGSTFTSGIFQWYPNSLHVFEPASILGLIWTNNSLSFEYNRHNVFLEKIYSHWFNCETERMPTGLFRRWPDWGGLGVSTGHQAFYDCKRHRVGSYWGAMICQGYVREACLMAHLVTGKTVRLVNAKPIQKFIDRHPDITFIHAVRDPRGIIASRASLESYFKQHKQNHIESMCLQLVLLAPVFNNRTHNAFPVYYEHLANNTITAAQDAYRRLGLRMPVEVANQIEIAIGHTNITRHNAYDIIQSDPQAHINLWQQRLTIADLKGSEITYSCQQFFKLYSSVYKPFVK